MLKLLEVDAHEKGEVRLSLDDLAREGARRMLQNALEAEVAEYIARHQERDGNGHALVVRNGKAQARKVTVGSGVTYAQLAPWLDAKGYALHNLASLPHISIAGACATATHGSGDGNGNLSTAGGGTIQVGRSPLGGRCVRIGAGPGGAGRSRPAAPPLAGGVQRRDLLV